MQSVIFDYADPVFSFFFLMGVIIGCCWLLMTIIWSIISVVEGKSVKELLQNEKKCIMFVVCMSIGFPIGILAHYLFDKEINSPDNLKLRNAFLKEQVDSLKNEISIYKGMELDVKEARLSDDVYLSKESNESFYHYMSDCPGLMMEKGKIKTETLQGAINEGRIPCSVCSGKITEILHKGDRSEDADEDDASVYICTGETSTKYHSNKYCNGLSRCSGEIEEISEEEAESMGRTPCHLCY